MQSGSVNGALEIDRSFQRPCDPPLYLKNHGNKGLCSLKTRNIKIYHSGPSAEDEFKQREKSPSEWICRLGPHRVQRLRLAQVFGPTQPPPGSFLLSDHLSPHPLRWEPEVLTTMTAAGPDFAFPSPPGWPGQASLQDPSSRGSCTAHRLGCQLCQPARSVAKPSLAAGVQEEGSQEPGL